MVTEVIHSNHMGGGTTRVHTVEVKMIDRFLGGKNPPAGNWTHVHLDRLMTAARLGYFEVKREWADDPIRGDAMVKAFMSGKGLPQVFHEHRITQRELVLELPKIGPKLQLSEAGKAAVKTARKG